MFPRKILLAAVLTLGPCAAQAATVMQSIFQAGNNVDFTNTSVNFTFINDDIGATYNSTPSIQQMLKELELFQTPLMQSTCDKKHPFSLDV